MNFVKTAAPRLIAGRNAAHTGADNSRVHRFLERLRLLLAQAERNHSNCKNKSSPPRFTPELPKHLAESTRVDLPWRATERDREPLCRTSLPSQHHHLTQDVDVVVVVLVDGAVRSIFLQLSLRLAELFF